MAATEGSTCFLLLPTRFWELPDVAPLVRQQLPAAGCRLLTAGCRLLTAGCRLDSHTKKCRRPWACLLRCGHDMTKQWRGLKEIVRTGHLNQQPCLPASLSACVPACPCPHTIQVPLLDSTSTFGNSGLFDGLVHVRFSFDRAPLRRMQQAIAAAGQQQLAQAACWLPPGGGLVQEQGGSSQGGGPEVLAAAQERLEQLQPEADAVAAVAASMQERGSQRLNGEQRQAVAAVVCGAGRAVPFALFGPPGVFCILPSSTAAFAKKCLLLFGVAGHCAGPADNVLPLPPPPSRAACPAAGTGKTVTLVECTLQLLAVYPHARLLLCAPQASAACI